MLGTYYYHEIIRRTIIAFGTLFNTIDIKHKTQDGKNYSEIRIPVAYGPTEKFLARLEQKPDPRKRVAITLPRIAFELSSKVILSKIMGISLFSPIEETKSTVTLNDGWK